MYDRGILIRYKWKCGHASKLAIRLYGVPWLLRSTCRNKNEKRKRWRGPPHVPRVHVTRTNIWRCSRANIATSSSKPGQECPWRDEVETALNTSYSRPSWCTASHRYNNRPLVRVWIIRDENLSRDIYHLRGDAFQLTELSPPLLSSRTHLLPARTQFVRSRSRERITERGIRVNGIVRFSMARNKHRSRLRSRLIQHRWRGVSGNRKWSSFAVSKAIFAWNLRFFPVIVELYNGYMTRM